MTERTSHSSSSLLFPPNTQKQGPTYALAIIGTTLKSCDFCGPFVKAPSVLHGQLGFLKFYSAIPIAQCSASARSVPSGLPGSKRSMRLNHITPQERLRLLQHRVRPRMILVDMPSTSATLRKLQRSTQCVPRTTMPTLQRPRASTTLRSEAKIYKHSQDYPHLCLQRHSVNIPSAQL